MKSLLSPTGNLTEKSKFEDFEGSIIEVNNKLETALTAKQESEARAMTLEEKVKQYEQELIDMKEKVKYQNNIIWNNCFHKFLNEMK